MKKTSSQNYRTVVWTRLKKDRLALLGLVFVLFLFLTALLAPLLANSRPLYLYWHERHSFPIFSSDPKWNEINFKKTLLAEGDTMILPLIPYSPSEYNLDAILLPPSINHWMGTDDRGRDIASRMIHGSRISLSVGFIAVGLYVLIGIFLGALAGYFGGWIDIILSRLIEIMICFPVFFLILAVLAFIGPSIYNIMIVIGVTSWTGIARLVRGEFLKLRKQDFVMAAQTSGASHWRIIFRHILPNSLAPVFVSATFGVAAAILVESSLSFLGFGVQPPTPSWGDILSQSRDFIDVAWWLTIFPGLAIFITITAYNLLGEGLRDAIDPKMKL